MNNYQHQLPRIPLAIAAIAMTAVTLGSLVIWPSRMDPASQTFATMLNSSTRTAASIEVAISPSCIDVIGVREQKTAFEPSREVPAQRAQQG